MYKKFNKKLKNIKIILVRFCVDYRIKPHVPPFEQIPANSVKFKSCDYTTQAEYFTLAKV